MHRGHFISACYPSGKIVNTQGPKRPAEPQSAPEIPFEDSASAARWHDSELPAPLKQQLTLVLAEAADPDLAVLQLQVLVASHGFQVRQAFASSATIMRATVAVLSHSRWLGQTLLQNPDLLKSASAERSLHENRTREGFAERLARHSMRAQREDLSVSLARFRRREYVRIFARELLQTATIAEITEEISALSDVIIQYALEHCENVLRNVHGGWPQLRNEAGRAVPARFSVLSLGKLGGNELNYSSDVDLLFVYDDGEDTKELGISVREFFVRLAQELTGVLSRPTAEGPIFRVDLRLRPQGADGEIAMGIRNGLRYYRTTAHDWELQALIKMRHSAGDRVLAREFIREAQSLVFPRDNSLDAIRTAAKSLRKIKAQGAGQNGKGVNLKTDRGGLREIEFAAQCLQRVYGGREKWLRSSGTLFALQKLCDKHHIGDVEFRELSSTYTFLRSIEHRLQCEQGRQVYRMPTDRRALRLLERSLHLRPDELTPTLKSRMESAATLCDQVLRWGTDEHAEPAPAAAIGEQGAERLAPKLANDSAAICEALRPAPDSVLSVHLRRFLAAASTSDERMATALGSASVIERALPIFEHSALLTRALSRHPEDLACVFSEPAIPPDVSADELRAAYRRRTLYVASQSILQRNPVWKSLAEQTATCELLIRQALKMSGESKDFAVLALGRLGSRAFDVLSDADLVFVRGPSCDSDTASQIARGLMETLSSYTREGTVVAVDTRLRAHGREGELVTTPEALSAYFLSDAQPWEALAYAKMRLIAGNESLNSPVRSAVADLYRRFASSGTLAQELRALRLRLERSHPTPNLRTGPGGTYDIDYICGYGEIRLGINAGGLQLHERVRRLQQLDFLTETDAAMLERTAELLLTVEHALRLVEGSTRKWLPSGSAARHSVEYLCRNLQLEREMVAAMQGVREVFDRIFEH